jgi:hypothetical protein
MPVGQISSREVRKLSFAAQSIRAPSDLLKVVNTLCLVVLRLRSLLNDAEQDWLRSLKGLLETILALVLSAYADHGHVLAPSEHSELLQLFLDVPVSLAVQSVAQHLSLVQNVGASFRRPGQHSGVSIEVQQTDLLLRILEWRVYGAHLNPCPLSIRVGKEAVKVRKG